MKKLLKIYSSYIFLFSPKTILTLILAIAAGLMFYSSYQESAIMDELAHIPAGYSYVSELDYRLNPEHPPLVKTLSAIPLLALDLNFPKDAAWDGVNNQWEMGAKFLYDGPNDPNTIVRTARIAPILLTLLLVFLVYYVSKKRIGSYWALVSSALVAFSPTILAHGHYVTTDVGASLGILFAIWRFVELLRKDPVETKDIWFAGLALGIAEILKFSAVLLLPFFVLLAIAHYYIRRGSIWKESLKVLAVFGIAYLLVVYPTYALLTSKYPSAKQISDTEVLLQSFHNKGTTTQKCRLWGCLADLDTEMTKHTVTRPAAEYLLGVLMVKQRSDAGNTAYFLGRVSASGSPFYFPVAYLTKETLPALLIILVPLLLALQQILSNLRRRNISWALREYLRYSFFEFSLILFVVLYWIYSILSPLNIGVRHILPTIPLLYILAATGWKKWSWSHVPKESSRNDILEIVKKVWGAIWKMVLLIALLLWAVAEALIAAPHFLPYYNELAGGTKSGYKLITDSNYDWGQDLLALQKLLDGHPEVDKIAVDYFGGGNAEYYLKERARSWSSKDGDPRAEGIHWIAVSANALQEAIQPKENGFYRPEENTYSWLTAELSKEPGMGGVPTPDLVAGRSIFVYHLP
jgi:4-amino-4-deoxy-L-arabinose transferase-like glycosyltransferase